MRPLDEPGCPPSKVPPPALPSSCGSSSENGSMLYLPKICVFSDGMKVIFESDVLRLYASVPVPKISLARTLEKDAAGWPAAPTSAASGWRFAIIVAAAGAMRDAGIVLTLLPVSPYSLVKLGRHE